MFRISRRLDYGLKLLVALADEDENKPLATSVLAERLHMPLPFLHQIGHVLMQSGFIKASPGPRGGLRLGRDAGMISIREVMEALEGNINLNPDSDEESAHGTITESLNDLWNDLQARIVEYLSGITLETLSKQGDLSGEGFVKLSQRLNQPAIEI